MKPTQAILGKIEEYVYKNVLDKIKEKAKVQIQCFSWNGRRTKHFFKRW